MPRYSSKSSTQRDSKATQKKDGSQPRTVAERIASVEAIAERHFQNVSVLKIEATSGVRADWLTAVLELSKTQPRNMKEAVEKTDYIRMICGLCLLPLALKGIVPDETHVVMTNLSIDIQAFGLPVPGETRH